MKKLNRQGFTLIEVVVVMAIIAVLAALIIGAILVARNTAKETSNRTNAKAMQAGMEAYYSRNRNYPSITSGTAFTAATGTVTGVSINTGAADCANGGGSVNSSTTGYTLTIFDSNCSGSIGTISGP